MCSDFVVILSRILYSNLTCLSRIKYLPTYIINIFGFTEFLLVGPICEKYLFLILLNVRLFATRECK